MHKSKKACIALLVNAIFMLNVNGAEQCESNLVSESRKSMATITEFAPKLTPTKKAAYLTQFEKIDKTNPDSVRSDDYDLMRYQLVFFAEKFNRSVWSWSHETDPETRKTDAVLIMRYSQEMSDAGNAMSEIFGATYKGRPQRSYEAVMLLGSTSGMYLAAKAAKSCLQPK
jgi:hypothetical protein